jgi:hypothetical protein
MIASESSIVEGCIQIPQSSLQGIEGGVKVHAMQLDFETATRNSECGNTQTICNQTYFKALRRNVLPGSVAFSTVKESETSKHCQALFLDEVQVVLLILDFLSASC